MKPLTLTGRLAPFRFMEGPSLNVNGDKPLHHHFDNAGQPSGCLQPETIRTTIRSPEINRLDPDFDQG